MSIPINPKVVAILFQLAGMLGLVGAAELNGSQEPDLWSLAQKESANHRYSVLFEAPDVKNRLTSQAGLDQAVSWCKRVGVTKVYLEEFRDGYQTDRAALLPARDRFHAEGFVVAGCVTTSDVGKKSTGWHPISCYTDPATQQRIKSIFEFAASLFDEIMIDDFWWTDCACENCHRARMAHEVRIGDRTFPVAGDSWEDYRRELMARLSSEYVLGAGRRVNPKVRIIIKYPKWYDDFHIRGYDVTGETAEFDKIWVGTETRDYHNKEWGGTVQYEGFFIMRWLGGIGGEKCGGGWFDGLGTTEQTYIEQARQTILGGARESILYSYGGLQGETGPNDVIALRAQLPELFAAARQINRHRLEGVAAYKPANSAPENEKFIFDFVGMLGIPLDACHAFPTNAPAAFFSMHALKDPHFAAELSRYIKTGRPVLITDGLSASLRNEVDLSPKNVRVLRVHGDPKSVLNMSADEIASVRTGLLKPFRSSLDAPEGVALYLFHGGSWVLENFTDQPVVASMNHKSVRIEPRGWIQHWK